MQRASGTHSLCNVQIGRYSGQAASVIRDKKPCGGGGTINCAFYLTTDIAYSCSWIKDKVVWLSSMLCK